MAIRRHRLGAIDPGMAWVLDLDGVMWLAERPIPGSADAVGVLRDAGNRVMFLTNNSGPRVAELLAKFDVHGLAVAADDLVTSAQAAASLVPEGSRVLLCAGAGVAEALEARSVEVVDEGEADAVVVGFHRNFDYDRLTAAFRAIRGGARFIATNEDPTYPTPDGPIPGGGSIVASVARASGVAPEVAGKPHEPMAQLIRARLSGDFGDGMLVGDSPATDGLMAARLGLPFGLVLSGVTTSAPAPGADSGIAVVHEDLRSLVHKVLGHR